MSNENKNNIIVGNGHVVHRFGVIFDFATIGIVVTDREGQIININPYIREQFGYTKEQVLGRDIKMLIPQRFHASHIRFRNEYFRNPNPLRVGEGRDFLVLKRDGTEFPVEVHLSPYFIENESFVIAFVTDVTYRKQQQEMVYQQKQELEQATLEIQGLNTALEQKVEGRTKMLQETLAELEKSREELIVALENEKHVGELKSRFVTMASHEFRTPLSTILSSAFLLEQYNRPGAEEKRMKHIRRIRNSVAGLKSILDDFLSMGRLEEGLTYDAKQQLDPVEINSIIQKVIADMDQQLRPGQQIKFECKTNFSIQANVEVIKNIMINLLTNAIKFSEENSIIRIVCSDAGTALSIAVKDQGIGISKEDQKHLFDRFFRGKNAVHIQGTGLGLHIVVRYLELINGRIEMQSTLDVGTCFTFYIPGI